MKNRIFLIFITCLPFSILFSQELSRERIYEKHMLIENEKAKYLKKQRITQWAMSYPGDQSIDVTYYKLDLKITVPPRPKYITGCVTIQGKSLVNPLNSVSLDLQNALNVDSVKNASGTLPFSHLSNILTVTLDHPYGFNETFEINIYYRGVPGSSGLGSFFFFTQNGQQVVWSLSEPYGAPDWWPCKDDPKDKADSADIWINCHQAYKVGSNGILTDTVSCPSDTTHTYKWKTRYPIANYLISVSFTNYAESRNYFYYTPTDSMLIMNYIYPSNFSSWSTALAKTVGMLEIFSDIYGLYPFINEKYGHCQFSWGDGAMEHQTMTSTGSSNEYLIAHELAHQWFGDMITCRDWHHIWINEGFATYSQALYGERKYNVSSYWSEMNYNLNNAKNAEGSIWIQDITDAWAMFDENLTFCKGACILHMLRHVVGDTIFFNIMKTYALDNTYRFKTAVAEDFQSVAETVSGMDLDYFFQEWIYGENYPNYGLGWVSYPAGNQYRLQVRIKQTVNTPSPAFFTMPVDLKVTFSGGDTTVTVFNNLQDQIFTIMLNHEPTGVQLDPQQWILRDVHSIAFTAVDDPVNCPSSFRLHPNYPNPFNPATTIAFDLPEKAHVRLSIYNVIGQEVELLVNREMPAGSHRIQWNAKSLASGIYMYKLSTDGYQSVKKMILTK